jgi:hypothetical protein
LNIDDVAAFGAPKMVDPPTLAAGDANENGAAAEVAVCAPKPPNIGAAVDVVAAGAPKMLVAVEAGAVAPKPVNAGVLVAAPNMGAAVLVVAPNIFVAACWVPNGFVAAGAPVAVEAGAPKMLVVAAGAAAPNGVVVAG